jgi:stress-induced morphogen
LHQQPAYLARAVWLLPLTDRLLREASMTATPPATLQEWIDITLQTSFPGAQIRVTDTTGGGDHFEVEIAAPQFVGRSMIDQHRAVYDALGDPVGYEIHALGLKTRPLAH